MRFHTATALMVSVAAPSSVFAVLGRSDLTSAGGKIFSIEKIVLHPGFREDTLENDFALIRLAEPAHGFQPLELLTPAEVETLPSSYSALILGWGVTDSEVRVRPAKLQEALIPVVETTQCAERLGVDFFPQSMLCAGVLSTSGQETNGVDACFGDSGGPLMLASPGGWKLLGVTSWGFSCASSRYWGVYAKEVAAYSWIQSALSSSLILKRAPLVSGVPVVGKKLRCTAAVFQGQSEKPPSTHWIDAATKKVLSTRPVYSLRPSDRGKNIRCESRASNAFDRKKCALCGDWKNIPITRGGPFSLQGNLPSQGSCGVLPLGAVLGRTYVHSRGTISRRSTFFEEM